MTSAAAVGSVAPAVAGPCAAPMVAAPVPAAALLAGPQSRHREMRAAPFPPAVGSAPAAAAAAVFSISESVFVIADGEGIMGAAGHQLPQRPDVAAHADPQRAPGETAGPAQVQI